MIQAKEITLVPLSEIKLNPKNRNKHPPDQLDRLVEIIKYQGFRRPVTISNRTGFLSCGEGRYLAAKRLGLNAIPAMKQDYESEEQEYADGIADNTIDKWAELDLSSIQNDVLEFEDFNVDMLGFKEFALPEAFDPGADEDDVPEHVEPKTKLGDLYQLGEHRLLCGDSTNILQVQKLMNGEIADMVFTDPPYGMHLNTNYTSMKSEKSLSRNVKNYKKVAGDNEDFTPQLINTIFASFPEAKEVFIWGADYFAELIPNRNEGSMIVWDKTGGNDSLTNIYGSNFELCWSKSRHKRHIMRTTWKGFTGHNKTLDGPEKVHPTQKPIKLIDQFLERWGKETKNVADLFGGSGSTLIACEKTKRKCFMMELDPHYCDVIVARWEKYTGKKAELL